MVETNGKAPCAYVEHNTIGKKAATYVFGLGGCNFGNSHPAYWKKEITRVQTRRRLSLSFNKKALQPIVSKHQFCCRASKISSHQSQSLTPFLYPLAKLEENQQ